jgi:hypothetical protein
MIYHVTRSGEPNVVTVNADTARGAARIAADRHVGWEGVELRVTRPIPGEDSSDWMEQGEAVVVEALGLRR